MFEELRKKTFKKSLFLTVIVLIIGIGLVGWKLADLFFITDFTTLKPDEIGDQFVKLELRENYGCYLKALERNTRTGTERTTDLYYLILTGDEFSTDYRFMSVKVPARYEDEMEQMIEDIYNGIEPTPLTLRGKIKPLDDTDTRYFKQFFLEEDFTAEEYEAITLPYYIDFSYGSLSLNICFVCGILLVVYGVARIIKGSRGGYLKKFRKDMELGGYSETAIESDYAAARSFEKNDALKAGRLMIYYTSGSEIRAVPSNKLIWCYYNTITHRTNGVKTGTTFNVAFNVEGWKNEVTVSVSNEAVATDLLERIRAMFPWVVVGYTDELKSLYRKDRSQFLQLRYHTCEHIAVEPGLDIPGNSESSGA